MAWAAGAASPTPRFHHPPAARPAAARAAAPKLKLVGTESRRYASQLRQASRQPVDFAGHFVLATWGCGAGCVMGAAIDAHSGSVSMLPFTVSDWPLEVSEPLAYRPDSRLLVVQGSRNEQGHGTYYYEFDGRRFKLLAQQARAATAAASQ